MRALRLLLAIALPILSSSPAAGYLVRLDFREYPNHDSPGLGALGDCGAHVLGAGVTLLHDGGVGVWGDGNDHEIDGGEKATFSVNGPGSTTFRYSVTAASNGDGDLEAGEHFLEAFGPTNQSLGVVARAGVGTIDVGAAFGGATIERIEITAAADGLTVGWLEYAIPPGALRP